VNAPHNIQSEAHVNALFLSNQSSRNAPVGQRYACVSISQRAAENFYALAAHLGKLSCPKVVPGGIIRHIWYAGVESDFREVPVLGFADGFSKGGNVIVGVYVAERILCCIKKVLAVYERNRTLNCRLGEHWLKNNPARGCFQRVERGANKSLARITPRTVTIVSLGVDGKVKSNRFKLFHWFEKHRKNIDTFLWTF